MDLVESWWACFSFFGTSRFVFATKLKNLKFELKKWNVEVFGGVEVSKMRLLKEI